MISIITADDLAQADAAAVERFVDRRGVALAVAEFDLRGDAAAMFLYSDFAVAGGSVAIHFDTAAAWGGAFWRIGSAAARFHYAGMTMVPAAQALAAGLCDALLPAGTDAMLWPRNWIGTRSTLALTTAAGLIRRRGGDSLERAEFARLFAAGEPQEGLQAFLRKRLPQWNEG